MHLTIIQYRSDGEDTCMGCSMGSSGSDFEINHTTDPEEAASIITNRMLQDTDSGSEYAGWEIVILQNGFDEDFDEYDYDLKLQIMDKAKKRLNIIIIQRELDTEREQAEKQKQKDVTIREKDLRRLAELLKKYPDVL